MKWVIVILFLGSVGYVHLRGKVRLKPLRQLFDHSALMAPINVFMYACSGTPNRPFLPVDTFPELRELEAHWQTIRDEALALQAQARIKAAEKNNDAGFNSFFKEGWKRFYLKWYGASHPSAEEYCPHTVQLLRRMPSVKAALFAELPAGAHLNKHRDPYAGSLRYHLGLVTPGSDRCYIAVDGERYSWRDGQSAVFDETYIHWVENDTPVDRIILFCDIERPMKYRWAQAVNHFFGSTLVRQASSPNREGDRVGFLNRLFILVWHAGQYRRRFKNWNKRAYLITKGTLIVGVIALFVFV